MFTMKIIKSSFSEAGQESFVINILDGKKNGYFVEIGAYHSTLASNTYILENNYNFKGVGLEIDSARADEYNLNRKNPCIKSDAMKFDYRSYLAANNFPSQIDYLQVDIEPALNTFRALLRIMSTGYRFSIITFEHDGFRNHRNKIIRKIAKTYLRIRGYILVVANVSNPKAPLHYYEDWYLDSKIFSKSFIKLNKKQDVCSSELFNL